MNNVLILQKKITGCIFGIAILFTLIGLLVVYVSESLTRDFNVVLKNGTEVKIVIKTSTSYNENDWKSIGKIVVNESTKTTNLKRLKNTISIKLKKYTITKITILVIDKNVFLKKNILKND